ncbi:hypothetical protein [Nitrosospira briensis]|uniref:hypothetical protein n=1 Tax=Nitrosospira briensis TaxID=35799 RepID=UPI0004691469|nr:hypothetical protein [Nitrosospira briensis]
MERARQRCHTPAAELASGSQFTQEWAQKIDRPCLHVYRCHEGREWIRIFVHEVLDEMLANSSDKKRSYDIKPKITIK